MREREQGVDASEFRPELSTETKALAAVREDVDDDIDFRELLETHLEDVEEWARRDRRYRKRLYAKFEAVYEIYVRASGNPKREALVQRRCNSAGITETRASHLSIRLVKLLLRPAEKTTYQYAAALRYAVLKQIPVDDFAATLEKDGGIANFAVRFHHKASKPSSDGADHSQNRDEASDEASSCTGEHRGRNGAKHGRPSPATPVFDWPIKALNVYRDTETGTRIKQVAERRPSGRWKVIKARALT